MLRSSLQQKILNALFGTHITGVVFDTYNGLMSNSLSEVLINTYLGFGGSYDKSKVAFLLSMLKEDDTVYIIGAHIGTLVVPVGKLVKEVIAFEPNPETFQLLDRNIQLNHLQNIQIFNHAVYSEETEISFYQSKVNSGGSKVRPVTDDYMYNYDNPETIKVSSKILDAFVQERSINMPDVIIIDIEGAEFHALKGASRCLQHARCLYIEFVPHHLTNVANITVDDFAKAITSYFPLMKVIDDAVKDTAATYEGENILLKLRELFNENICSDLLFYKY
jgi:FkbM family methyltransferase